MAVCAGPVFAQADQLARDCDQDPKTTGALRTDPRSLYMPGERPVRADVDSYRSHTVPGISLA